MLWGRCEDVRAFDFRQKTRGKINEFDLEDKILKWALKDIKKIEKMKNFESYIYLWFNKRVNISLWRRRRRGMGLEDYDYNIRMEYLKIILKLKQIDTE